MKDLGKLGVAATAEEVARHLGGLNIAQAATVETGKTVEPQIDLPKGTYLTSQAPWLLKLKGVPAETLVKLNGPKKYWSLPEMASCKTLKFSIKKLLTFQR